MDLLNEYGKMITPEDKRPFTITVDQNGTVMKDEGYLGRLVGYERSLEGYVPIIWDGPPKLQRGLTVHEYQIHVDPSDKAIAQLKLTRPHPSTLY